MPLPLVLPGTTFSGVGERASAGVMHEGRDLDVPMLAWRSFNMTVLASLASSTRVYGAARPPPLALCITS